MRRFILSSKNITGNAELLYNNEGILCKIDFEHCSMNVNQVTAFKKIAPVIVTEIETAFKNTNLTVIESDYEVTFDMFWKKYDKKINKVRALPLWNKLSKVDQINAFYGVDKYTLFLSTKADWRSKSDPENYLRNRMWENEWK